MLRSVLKNKSVGDVYTLTKFVRGVVTSFLCKLFFSVEAIV